MILTARSEFVRFYVGIELWYGLRMSVNKELFELFQECTVRLYNNRRNITTLVARDRLVTCRDTTLELGTSFFHEMPQTRSTSKNVGLGKKTHNEKEAPRQEHVSTLPSGDNSTPSSKKRQGGYASSPKKRRRGNPGELCQLNIDVLFIVHRILSFLGSLLMNATIDCHLRPSFGPPEPCTYVQVTPKATDGQIIGIRLEGRSPPI